MVLEEEKISPFEKCLSYMTNPAVMILYVLGLSSVFLWVDQPLAAYFQGLKLESTSPWLTWLTETGANRVYLILFLSLVLIFQFIYPHAEGKARSGFLLLCVMVPTLICGALKLGFGRARPSMWFTGEQYGFYGFQLDHAHWSFPSGHTTTLISLVLGLGILFPRYFTKFLVIGLALAFLRVILLHHYLSDILFASYLTLLEVGIVWCIVRKKKWLAPGLRQVLE